MNRHRPGLSPDARALLLVLSGPSGVGKDAVLAGLKQSGYPLEFIVTMTTRPRRPQETDGVDYRFVTEAEFQQLISENGLLEHARVYGNWYGVPAKEVNEALHAGRDTIVKVDVQGAATIKKKMPQSVAVFLAPPSREDLMARLKGRKTESPSDLAVRVNAAGDEFAQVPLFDYVVISHSDEIERAVADIRSIIFTEKCRPTSQQFPGH